MLIKNGESLRITKDVDVGLLQIVLSVCPVLHKLNFAFQVLVASLKFFLGRDEDEKRDSDSESEVGVVIKSCPPFFKL